MRSGVATICREGVPGAVPRAAECGLAGMFADPGRGSVFPNDAELSGVMSAEFSGDELRELDGEGRCLVTGLCAVRHWSVSCMALNLR